MAQFVVSSYQLQKWASTIRSAQQKLTDEVERQDANRSMDELRAILKTQGEEILTKSEYANPK